MANVVTLLDVVLVLGIVSHFQCSTFNQLRRSDRYTETKETTKGHKSRAGAVAMDYPAYEAYFTKLGLGY